jgi:hypothetical protein
MFSGDFGWYGRLLIAAFPNLGDWILILGKIWVLIFWSIVTLIGVLLSAYSLTGRARIKSSEKKIKIKKNTILPLICPGWKIPSIEII